MAKSLFEAIANSRRVRVDLEGRPCLTGLVLLADAPQNMVRLYTHRSARQRADFIDLPAEQINSIWSLESGNCLWRKSERAT